jgi:hypothetical protein
MQRLLVPFLAAFSLASAVAGAGAEPVPAVPAVREWRFQASLDGRPIGRHTFRVTDRGDVVEVDSRASFDVRLFGFSVYTYEHRASERWKDGCLVALDSRTDDNGEVEVVKGSLAGEGFSLTRRNSTTLLPPCTMTFAYWNPAIRTESRLLNPQNGDYVDVLVEDKGTAKLGTSDASRFTIRGKDLEIELWYEAGGTRWLALDSTSGGGGLISYRLEGEDSSAGPAPE